MKYIKKKETEATQTELRNSRYVDYIIKRGIHADTKLKLGVYKFASMRDTDIKYSKLGKGYEALNRWLSKRLPDMEDFPNGGKFLEIRIPFLDKEKCECRPTDALLVVKPEKDAKGYEYDSFSVTKSFSGHRLDWEPWLLLEFLENQERIDEWCEEYSKTFQFKEKTLKIKRNC